MSNKIALQFLRGWGHYNAKDVAGFDPDHAEALIQKGYAKKAAARSEAKVIAQLNIEGPDMKAMVDQAVAGLRAEIEDGIAAREAEIEGDKASLELAWAAYEAKAEALKQREADLEARIAAMGDEDTLIVDADGVVIETVEEVAKPAKATGLPKQGK